MRDTIANFVCSIVEFFGCRFGLISCLISKYAKEKLSKLLSRKENKMALSQDTINASEMAKNYVMNSDLDEEYKETLVDLINTSLIATNGISPEEKIQKMTNSIHKLAISQVGLIKSIKDIMSQSMREFNDGIEKKIKDAIKESNDSKCQNCRALEHAKEVDKETERKRIIDDFIAKSGMKQTVAANELGEYNAAVSVSEKKPIKKDKIDLSTIINKTFSMLEKPYIYIFLSIAVISPYGLEIIKLLLQYFGK